MSSAGIDYFDNLNKYKGEATASMDTYKQHALEKVQEGNKGIKEKVDAAQKAGLGISALGMATKSINKQIPKSWLQVSEKSSGYNFQEIHDSLHSKQMSKGGGDGLHYEVPEENFNSPRQARPGDRMRGAVEPEPEGIYERLTEPTNLDSNVSSQIPDTDAETNIDVANPRATQTQGGEAETNIDLASPRVDSADVEPNVIDDTQATEEGLVGDEDQARQFTQQDSIYDEGIDSEIQKQPVQSLEESTNKIQANAQQDILDDEIQPAQVADGDRIAVGSSRPYGSAQGVDTSMRPPTPTGNRGGSALRADDQAKLDSLTDGATEAEDLLEQSKTSSSLEKTVEGGAEEGFENVTKDALLGAEGGAGEEAVAVGIDSVGMASGVGEAVGATLLLGSLAYELSTSSSMKTAEEKARDAMPTQAASYGGADIQSSGATGRGIV